MTTSGYHCTGAGRLPTVAVVVIAVGALQAGAGAA
ncbi:hypothetical protein SHL15_7865 [Streptomyces hygroscopicus subsp. limoneus]|nr:hypothetical protein SHL15_7865 [Streptomyces hygroscopicus subsp. limoneus]